MAWSSSRMFPGHGWESSICIAGASKPEQVEANVRAGEWTPNADDVAALSALR